MLKKKTIVKILSIALSVFMLLTAVPLSGFAGGIEVSAATSGTCGENLTWNLDYFGLLTIEGTGEMTNWTSSTYAPWYSSRASIKQVNIGSGVTTIGNYAFRKCTAITTVDLSACTTLASIGYNAFDGCTALAEADLSACTDLNSIGSSAFNACTALTAVNLSTGLNSIGELAFNGCIALTEVDLSGCSSLNTIGGSSFKNCTELTAVDFTGCTGLNSIGGAAFFNCTALTTIDLSACTGLNTIEYSAFNACSALTTVNLSGCTELSSIGEEAFFGCSALTDISIANDNQYFASQNGVLFSKAMTELIVYPIGKTDTVYTVPAGVTTICKYAFYNCTSLTAIDLSACVALSSIGESAFSGCTALAEIRIGSDTCIIYDGSTIPTSTVIFCNVGSSSQEYARKYNRTYKALDGHAHELSQTVIAPSCTAGYTAHICSVCSETVYIDNVTPANGHSDSDSDGICDVCGSAYVAITASGTCGERLLWSFDGNGLLTIDGTGAMTSWTSSSSLVPWYSYRPSIKQVKVGSGVTSIGNYAFNNYNVLTAIDLSACTALSSIGDDSFLGCPELTDISIANDNQYYASQNGVLFNKAMTSLICYPAKKADTAYTVPASVTNICKSAFRRSEALTEIDLSACTDLSSIGDSSFEYCTALTGVDISSCTALRSIGKSSFSNCNALTGIDFLACTVLRSIGDSAFSFCKALTEIDLSACTELSSIGSRAFYKCTGLDGIKIGSTDCSIYTSADTIDSGATIYGYTDSTAQEYATRYSRTFVALNSHTHTPGEWVIEQAAGCTTEGSRSRYCTSCPLMLETEVIPALGHWWSEGMITTPATYTENGVMTFTCIRCHETRTEVIDAIGYNCGIDGDNLTWSLDDDGLLTIEGTGAMANWTTETSMPWYPSRSSIKQVKIGSGVTTIGSYAFTKFTALKAIDFSDCTGLLSIGSTAFYKCTGLTEVDLSACTELNSIENLVFFDCNALDEIKIGSTDCIIDDSENVIPANATIYGYAGSTAQAYAIRYGRTFVDFNAHIHTPGEWVITQEAGCTTNGSRSRSCTDCLELLETEAISALGHDYIAAVTEVTCTEQGYTTYTCSRCGDSYTADEIPSLGHDYIADVTEVTCTEQGYTTYTCSRCGDSYIVDEIPPLGHDPVNTTPVEPTCTQIGKTGGTNCSVCGEILTPQTDVPALGHTVVDDEAMAATCTQAGHTAGTHCSVCNEILTGNAVIAAPGHTVVYDIAMAATCTEDGITSGAHCSVCGEVFTPQAVIPALGHTAVDTAGVAPTCTETGLTAGTYCSVCGKVITAQTVIEAIGHDYIAVVTAPTCATQGFTTYTCSRCADSYTADMVPALDDHAWNAGEITTAATCTEAGVKAFTCGVCAKTRTEVIDATGHAVVDDEEIAPTCAATGLTAGTHCSTCGEVITAQTVVATLPHTVVDNAAVAATCTATGLTAGTHCSTCGKVLIAQTAVSALGHSDANADGYCDRCGADLTPDEPQPELSFFDKIAAFFKKIIDFFKNLFT